MSALTAQQLRLYSKQLIEELNKYRVRAPGTTPKHLTKASWLLSPSLSTNLVSMDSILSKAADLVLAPAFNFLTRQLRYPFKAGDNVRDLESATRGLLVKKDNLKAHIEIARRNGQKPTPQVQGWLDEVEATKAQVDEIVDKYNQRRLCFKCFSPDCCSMYSLSRSATKMLLDVERMLNDEPKEEIAITPVPPPVQEVSMLPTLISFGDAISNLGEALRYIKEEQVGMIGIWGMGGVGKSHLLQQINNSFINDSSFGVVIFVTASRSCTTEKLQSGIVKNQSLKEGGDVKTQANIIFNFLRETSFLLLLDDIWEKIDLQKVGIPFPLGIVGGCKRKVVLTTRLRNVCGQMEVRKQINVKSLNHDDALSLFVEKVGKETINSHPRIPNLAGELVKELDGLPLAVVTTGRAMYGKNDPSEWEYSINLLRKSQLHEVEDSCQQEGSMFYRLKFSYDSLKSDTLRECFLSCCMWREDEEISKSDLIELWMGLGLIKEFVDMSEAYNTGYALIGDLIGACLLEPDHETVRAVRMHDVLRDMAIWIARDNGKKKNKWIVPVRGNQSFGREIWHEAERISLMYGKILEIPPITSTASTSKLTTLNIQYFSELKGLRNIRAFVALTYLSLSFCDLDCFPIEICGLVQLQYLNLSGITIPSLPEELKSLANLKFLILRYTGIRTIPPDVIGTLKTLQVLDLSRADTGDTKLTYLESLVKELECLKDLRILGISVESMSQLHKIIQLPNLSVGSLDIRRLEESTSFSLISSFLWDENIQSTLNELSIVDSNVTQVVIEGNHQHPRWNFQALQTLQIKNTHCLEEIIWKGVVPKELFQAVQAILIMRCDMLKNVSWVLHLPCLENLYVSECSSMRQLIVCEEENHGENVADTVIKEEEKEVMLASTFPSLKTICLTSLPEMVSICHSTISFPALKMIMVYDCPKLKKLPFRPGKIPSKLRNVSGSKEWWEGLEWEDNSVKTSLQPFFKE